MTKTKKETKKKKAEKNKMIILTSPREKMRICGLRQGPHVHGLHKCTTALMEGDTNDFKKMIRD